MKKTLLFLFTIFTFSFASGQGNNLQFSQVKLVSALETVPVEKAWKITNVLPSQSFNSQAANCLQIKVNSNLVVLSSYYNLSGGERPNTMVLQGAIWLPAGTTLETFQSIEYISVMEFNIVP
jgi:hypothetical protein